MVRTDLRTHTIIHMHIDARRQWYRERGTWTVERSTDWRNTRRARGKDPAGCKDERSCVTSMPVLRRVLNIDRRAWTRVALGRQVVLLYHRAAVSVRGIPLLLCALTHRHLNASRSLCMQVCKNIPSSFRRESIRDYFSLSRAFESIGR